MEPGKDDPAVQRRRLRQELRALRKARDVTQRDVASEMEWSTSKLIRIENGEVGISVNDLRALLAFYRVTDKRRVDELLDMARTARKESWSTFKDVHSNPWLLFLAYEASASVIRAVDILYVPGLLQTEEYARAVLTDALGHPEDIVDGRWEARERRQQLLDRPEPPKTFFIIDESIIRRPIGGPGVMRKQLIRLREAADQKNVTIQVMPFSVGGHRGLGGSYVHLEFADPRDEDIVHIEQNPDGVTVRDDPEEAQPYLSMFFDMEDQALTPDQTKALLDDAIDGKPADVPAPTGAQK